MPINSAYGNSIRSFADVAAEFYSSPPVSPFLASGFLCPGVNINEGKEVGETYNLQRTPKAIATAKRIHDRIIGGFLPAAQSTVSDYVYAIRSFHSGTSLAYIPKEIITELISAEGPSTQWRQRVSSIFNSHYTAVCQGIDKQIFDCIYSTQQIKTDGMAAVDKGLVEDGGRGQLKFGVDLTRIDSTTYMQILFELAKCLTNNGASVSLREAGSPIYVILPEVYYLRFLAAFDGANRAAIHHGSMQSDGTGPGVGAMYFTAYGYIFVGLPDGYFIVNTDGTEEFYQGYVLTQNSMSYFLPYVDPRSAMDIGSTVIPTGMQRAFFTNHNEYGTGVSTGGDAWSDYTGAIDNSQNDPILNQFLAAQGKKPHNFFYSATYHIHRLPPSGAGESESVTIYADSLVSGVRSRPHFIQTVELPKDFKLGA